MQPAVSNLCALNDYVLIVVAVMRVLLSHVQLFLLSVLSLPAICSDLSVAICSQERCLMSRPKC